MRLKRYIVIIIIIVILVVILHALRWPIFIGKIFFPFQYFFSGLDKKINQASGLISSKINLLEENKKLSTEITKLITENIKLKIIEEENERLRQELNFTKRENYKSILANMIGRKKEAGTTWFIVDRGTRDGIQEGFAATSEGMIVGKIMKTMENISYLLPLFDERVRLAIEIVSPGGKIGGKDKIEGIAKGRNGLAMEIDLVPLDKKINNGDLVLTSGLEFNLPKGFLVGTLKDVESKSTNLFYKAIIEVPIKLEGLEIINIIIPKSE